MELFSQDEIQTISKSLGCPKVVNWSIENYASHLIGYLGDHLRLKIEVESSSVKSELNLFVKCMPRSDQWKADYVKKLSFFKKEYCMLNSLFTKFKNKEGTGKWHPKTVFIKEEVFVFEDVVELGYTMPSHLETLSLVETMAIVEAIAKFHAQSYTYEENRSKELNRPYRIWEDYKEYLQEPIQDLSWRNTGRNAIIDFLKVNSKYKNNPNFSKSLKVIIPMLFRGALTLMKPSTTYRNTVVHRDLWTNNIFLKKFDRKFHALIVDFQTVLYASPMLDLSSLMFFNTTRSFRNDHTTEILDLYFKVLTDELKAEEIDINLFFNRASLEQAYEDSIMFGITQAAIVVPIICMSVKRREELFSNPETSMKINVVSRSEEFIQIAEEDRNYANRVTELFDEIVDRYIYKIQKLNV